jgi:hypothetical protein
MDSAKHIKIDRETMIDHLVLSMFDAMTQDNAYMVTIIEEGFKGFHHYSDEELITEYRDYISEDENYPVVIELEECA